jgi:hypothetical protein
MAFEKEYFIATLWLEFVSKDPKHTSTICNAEYQLWIASPFD